MLDEIAGNSQQESSGGFRRWYGAGWRCGIMPPLTGYILVITIGGFCRCLMACDYRFKSDHRVGNLHYLIFERSTGGIRRWVDGVLVHDFLQCTAVPAVDFPLID